MEKIKIIGISNLSRLENYIDSNMIDIMYVGEIYDDVITLLFEREIHLDNSNDKEWILELINQALSQCQEHNAKVMFPS